MSYIMPRTLDAEPNATGMLELAQNPLQVGRLVFPSKCEIAKPVFPTAKH
jgi:hypothetical protein